MSLTNPRGLRTAGGVVVLLALVLTACASPPSARQDGRLRVVATTPIIADIASQVGGEHATVSSVLPLGADPHAFEPSLRDARDVAYADIALTNHLMLEEERIMRTVRSTLPPESELIELSEQVQGQEVSLLPVVENQLLDQLWLGARVRGERGAVRQDQVTLRLMAADGPGEVHGFLTRTFGSVDSAFDSTRPGTGGLSLPPGAHTHLSWAFTQPGIYRLTLQGHHDDGPVTSPAQVTVAVGVDPKEAGLSGDTTVVQDGHADLTVDLDHGQVKVSAQVKGARGAAVDLDVQHSVLRVGPKSLTGVPAAPSYRFLGRPGDPVYLLPQAVLGKHVHGTLDPHVWLDPEIVKAWTERIRDAYITADPQHAEHFRHRAAQTLAGLDQLKSELRELLQRVPQDRRQLVTTHDAFAYLARAFDLEVAGFAVPATAAQPGLHGQARLSATLRDAAIPAVFNAPGESGQTDVLRRVAGEAGAQVCTLRSDVLDEQVPDYAALMRTNVREIVRCLGHE